MKGWIIGSTLLALVLGLGFALLRQTHADLERLEAEIADHVSSAEASLDAATRSIGTLRTTRPNLPTADTELLALRRQCEEARKQLSKLESVRPNSGDPRGPLLAERIQFGQAALGISVAAKSLADRLAILERFSQSGQNRIHLLNEAVQRTFELRNELKTAGKEIPKGLLDKLDALQAKRKDLQDLSRSIFAAGSGVKRSEREATITPDQLRIQTETIENEANQMITDLESIFVELTKMKSA